MLYLLPTDTCYGLAGQFNEQDYNEIYRLKGREFQKQLALLVETFDDMKKYIEITDVQIEFLKNYPYPWSFLGKRNREFVLPGFLDDEKYDKISIRVAENCIPHNITPPNLPFSGEGWKGNQYPLFLTSANISGAPESKTLTEARETFPGVEGRDGGICDQPPSDIFSLDGEENLVYRRRNYGV